MLRTPRKTIFFFLLIVFLFTVPVCAQNTATVITAKALFLSRPNISSPLIGSIKKGSKVRVLNTQNTNGWYYVAYGTQKGWVHGNSIEMDLTDDEFDEYMKTIWVQYASSSDSVYSYNLARMRKFGRVVQVWTHQKLKDAKYISSITLYELGCGISKYRILSSVEYEASGSVSHSLDTPKDSWKFIVPDSVTEGLYDAVCKK